MARVLVVEDEQTDRLILAGIVEGMGHEVYFASDGEQAFKTYVRMSIDVVVTDLLMPHVDGRRSASPLTSTSFSRPSQKRPPIARPLHCPGRSLPLGVPRWNTRVDGASIGRVEANLYETKETVREAATKLIEDR